MKILKFNETFEYSEEVKNKIISSEWIENKIRYHIATPKDKNPETSGSYSNLDGALEQLHEMNQRWKGSFCLFESRVRIVPEDEIDMHFNTKKYNV